MKRLTQFRRSIARPYAFTLVELVVAIAIIGLLIALLLPAIQSAREVARKNQCRNQLRQQTIAVANHESALGHLPSNGWGWQWQGEPGRGTNRRQPGGWIYNLLGYLDQQSLRRSSGVAGISTAALSETPLPMFTCPTRRSPNLTPQLPLLATLLRNSTWLPQVAKSDYAICEGDFITNTHTNPRSLAEGDDPDFAWDDVSKATGVSFLRSEIRFVDLRDGASQTILIGEKYVAIEGYETTTDPGHDQSMYTGVDLDINRWTNDPPLRDGTELAERRFGSAHTDGCHFAFCDGSVKYLNLRVDKLVYSRLGNRRDGFAAVEP